MCDTTFGVTISPHVMLAHTFSFRFTSGREHIDTNKCQDNSPLNAIVNKNERTLHKYILSRGKEGYIGNN